MIKQVFEHYEKWEDFKNGMWRKLGKDEENDMLIKAIEFTGNHLKYGKAMMRVINEWPITCRHNLSDKSINRKAFIGHAACSLEINCPEYITRMAWHYLNGNQQDLANNQADLAIKKWEKMHLLYVIKNNKYFHQSSLF